MKKFDSKKIATPPSGRISVFMGNDYFYYYKTHDGCVVKMKGNDYYRTHDGQVIHMDANNDNDTFNIHENNISSIINLTDNNIEILRSDSVDYIQLRFHKSNFKENHDDWWRDMPEIDLGYEPEWLGAGMKKLKKMK